MRLFLALLLFSATARADVGVDAVVSSSGLGFDAGTGVQLDADGQGESFGYDLTATWLRQAKAGGSGNRWNVQAATRYFPMQRRFAIEAGAAWTGYETDFPDGTRWEKSGSSPLIGAAWLGDDFELTLRYTGDDGTDNETESVYLSGEVECWGYICGLTLRHARFFSRGAERSDVQAA
ncbi:MAG: hypothetical protein AAGA95_10595, partial [Pseudomonadota bacterium]